MGDPNLQEILDKDGHPIAYRKTLPAGLPYVLDDIFIDEYRDFTLIGSTNDDRLVLSYDRGIGLVVTSEDLVENYLKQTKLKSPEPAKNLDEQKLRESLKKEGCTLIGRDTWEEKFKDIRFPKDQEVSLPDLAEIKKGIQEVKDKTSLECQLVYIPKTIKVKDKRGNWKDEPCTMELFNRVLMDRMQGANTNAKFHQVDWYANQKFYKETTVPAGYYLIPLGLASNSESKDWNKQETDLKTLSGNFATPKAVQLWYSMIMRYMTTGEYLHGGEWGWCEDETNADTAKDVVACHRVRLGNFDAAGLHVDESHPDASHSLLGRAFLRNSR